MYTDAGSRQPNKTKFASADVHMEGYHADRRKQEKQSTPQNCFRDINFVHKSMKQYDGTIIEVASRWRHGQERRRWRTGRVICAACFLKYLHDSHIVLRCYSTIEVQRARAHNASGGWPCCTRRQCLSHNKPKAVSLTSAKTCPYNRRQQGCENGKKKQWFWLVSKTQLNFETVVTALSQICGNAVTTVVTALSQICDNGSQTVVTALSRICDNASQTVVTALSQTSDNAVTTLWHRCDNAVTTILKPLSQCGHNCPSRFIKKSKREAADKSKQQEAADNVDAMFKPSSCEKAERRRQVKEVGDRWQWWHKFQVIIMRKGGTPPTSQRSGRPLTIHA